MRLAEIELESFRAFGKAQILDLRAHTVLLEGRNGFGKSTVYDGISWCLFGSAKRFGGTRDYPRDASYLVNAFRARTEPRVRLTFSDGTNNIIVERTGQRLVLLKNRITTEGVLAQEQLLAEFGFLKEAQENENSFLRRTRDSFSRSFLLHQELLASFITSSTPRERFDAFAELFALTPIHDFYTHLGEERGRAREVVERATTEFNLYNVQVSQIQRQLHNEEERAQLLADSLVGMSVVADEELEKLLAELREHLPDLAIPRGAQSDRIDVAVAQLTRADKGLEEEIRGLSDAEVSLPLLQSWLNQTAELQSAVLRVHEELEAKQSAVTSINVRLRELRQNVEDVQGQQAAREVEQERQVNFLTEALEMVMTDACPVCQRPISEHSLREQLRERLQQSDPVSQELSGKRLLLMNEVREGEQSLRLALAEVTTTQQTERSLAGQLKDLTLSAERVRAQVYSLIGVTAESVTVEILREQALSRQTIQTALRVINGNLIRLKPVFEITDVRTRLQELRNEYSLKHGQATNAGAQVERYSKAESTLDEMLSASRRAERTIVESLVNRFREPIQQAYRWLAPHPLFPDLEFRFGQFDQAGELYFAVGSGNATLNPATSFSSAQANALALAVFLSLNAAQDSTPLELALIDDPVQQMDSVNILSLVDLLRVAGQDRQLIISTSNPYLSSLLADKLRPDAETKRLITYHFEALTADGPVIAQEVLEYVESPEVLLDIIRLTA